MRSSADIGQKAVRNLLGGGFHRVPSKVGIVCGGLGLTVAEKRTDHPQAVPQGESPRGEGVA